MEESTCRYCGKPIYFGSREKEYKTDEYAAHEVWRHIHSKAVTCDLTEATPIGR